MTFEEALDTIGNKIATLASSDLVEHQVYPAPNLYQDITMTPGLVTVAVRWDGISLDSNMEFDVPGGLRFEVRLITDTYDRLDSDINPDNHSGYWLAQKRIADVSGSFYRGLKDRSLGGLVVGSTIISSFTGDLIDTVANTEYYGHEVILDVTTSL